VRLRLLLRRGGVVGDTLLGRLHGDEGAELDRACIWLGMLKCGMRTGAACLYRTAGSWDVCIAERLGLERRGS
jgi:hypothetical protein